MTDNSRHPASSKDTDGDEFKLEKFLSMFDDRLRTLSDDIRQVRDELHHAVTDMKTRDEDLRRALSDLQNRYFSAVVQEFQETAPANAQSSPDSRSDKQHKFFPEGHTKYGRQPSSDYLIHPEEYWERERPFSR